MTPGVQGPSYNSWNLNVQTTSHIVHTHYVYTRAPICICECMIHKQWIGVCAKKKKKSKRVKKLFQQNEKWNLENFLAAALDVRIYLSEKQ